MSDEPAQRLNRLAVELQRHLNDATAKHFPALSDGVVVILADPADGETIGLFGSLVGTTKLRRALESAVRFLDDENPEVCATFVSTEGQVEPGVLIDGVPLKVKSGTQ